MLNQPPVANTDMETGPTPTVHPKMSETPELRWSFIRRVYSIVILQLLLTIAFGAVSAMYLHPIFAPLIGGFACFLLPSLTLILAIYPLYCYRQRYPVNYVLLVLFIVSMAFIVGFACAVLASHKVKVLILEAGILTTVMVVSLTLFTFWAANRGYDFNFFSLLWSGSVMVFIVFGLIQIFSPLGKISVMIFGCFFAIIFCACIVLNGLITEYTYDDYVWAAWVCMVISSLASWFLGLLPLLGTQD